MTDSPDGASVHPVVPPLKCQGIKTKLVPFIASNLPPSDGVWIEPFLGSGVVAFSLKPQRALLCDTNPHIIRFYKALQDGEITPASTRRFLENEGAKLATDERDHFNYIRSRFNETGDPLDFLFVNRACFNGIMRFNRKGGFNVPWNKKPDRFAKAYVTKIVNQVQRAQQIIVERDWTFACQDWRETVAAIDAGDSVYADPPYISRYSDYFNKWEDDDTADLLKHLVECNADFAMSSWMRNRHRENEFFDTLPTSVRYVTTEHFYHVGATEALRSAMEEALILRA
ncbi:MAG: DNA adenine methylase [Acidimicrobiales bacterium]